MKKILEKDKKIREKIKILEQKKFVLKIIYHNFWFINLIRLNALTNLNELSNKSSKTFTLNKCVITKNKKRLNKLMNFSRIIFHKLAKKKKIPGIYKSSR